MRPEALPACGTRAPRRRAPARRRRRARARRSCARRGRHARAPCPRAAAGRPRSRAAPRRRPFGAARRASAAARALRERVRAPSADGSAGGAASSAARGRGIATARSNRSRSARESFSRYAASRCVVHAHSTAGSPRAPHGHMFIVPTSCEACREERVAADARDRNDAVLQRLSQRLEHGARELRQLVEEQHAAMRQRHLTRPRARPSAHDRRRGCAVMRRPKRRHRTRARVPGGSRPATEWIRVTSSASARVSAGRIPGKRRASIVFPVPGGPISRRLCEPAAAISSARRARSCPRTSARSGASELVGVLRQRLVRRSLDLSSKVRDDLSQVADGHGLDARERSLGRRLGRADDSRKTGTPRSFGDGERPRHRANPPVERRARRRRRGRRAAPEEAAWSHRARPARSGGRIPILPCAAPPARG